MRGLGVLCHGTEVVVIEQAVEFSEVDVGDPGIAADDNHVLIVRVRRCRAEVCRAGDHDGIVSQRISQQKLRVDIADMHVQLQRPGIGFACPLVHRVVDIRAPSLVDVVRRIDGDEGRLGVLARRVFLFQKKERDVALTGVVSQLFFEGVVYTEGEGNTRKVAGVVHKVYVEIQHLRAGSRTEHRGCSLLNRRQRRWRVQQRFHGGPVRFLLLGGRGRIIVPGGSGICREQVPVRLELRGCGFVTDPVPDIGLPRDASQGDVRRPGPHLRGHLGRALQ